MESTRVLTFDVGYRFIRHAVVTDGIQDVPAAFATPKEDSEDLFDGIANVVRQQQESIDGIALSLPGFVDVKKQRTITGGAVNALYKQNVGKELRRRLGDDLPIWVENDANCAAIAERYAGNARKLDDFVVFTITDAGVGGALFLDGHIRRGRDWRAGELGMMITNYQTEGARSLHEYSATDRLSERYAEKFGGPAEIVVPSSLLRRMNDPEVRNIVEEWAQYIAVGIYNVVVSLDPECVLLGGAVCQETAFMPLVEQALDTIPYWKDFATPIKRCRNVSYAGLIGAYYAFVTELQK
ncbi:glucokinase/Xylose repressor [Bifidobacterium saguini DSM 23967]|uniref:Glucokinase/Xylose repressor n=2 Tax=Bifidobacterium saguini TaxID=762210 RepID=A0A087D8J7_9BIFI|nr:ROK family protein [Bifidobacterium saguini]KFI91847.1 glucokinase/Xylose repressor [Bifidobacterium saguini DSM 23967]QTB90142.1 ROK family protein [Bifidobacterium saguini]